MKQISFFLFLFLSFSFYSSFSQGMKKGVQPHCVVATTSATSATIPLTKEGFALPQPGYAFQFPRDYGSHPEFKIEWWYITGHLVAQKESQDQLSKEEKKAIQDLDRFGFETTFFRQAIQPSYLVKGTYSRQPDSKALHHLMSSRDSQNHQGRGDMPSFKHLKEKASSSDTLATDVVNLTALGKNANDFGWEQFFMTDVALFDHRQDCFLYQKRLNRQGWDASAQVGQLALQNGNWSWRMTDPQKQKMELHVSLGKRLLDLQLQPTQPMVLFGKDGISRKGKERSACSYYMTFPRLNVTGSLTWLGKEEKKITLKGEAWMDHEVSSSQLGAHQQGWDWASLQLKDGWSVMAYGMREEGGKYSPYSSISWISPQSKLEQYGLDAFKIEPESYWKSPQTKVSYPVGMRLIVKDPRHHQWVTWHLRPLKKDQELVDHDHLSYWEGECSIENEQGVEIGSGFLELAGYDNQLAKRLHS